MWTSTQRTHLFALENIYFTDCILRFKNKFNFLAHFDPDEIPILKKHKTLKELLLYLKTRYIFLDFLETNIIVIVTILTQMVPINFYLLKIL